MLNPEAIKEEIGFYSRLLMLCLGVIALAFGGLFGLYFRGESPALVFSLAMLTVLGLGTLGTYLFMKVRVLLRDLYNAG